MFEFASEVFAAVVQLRPQAIATVTPPIVVPVDVGSIMEHVSAVVEATVATLATTGSFMVWVSRSRANRKRELIVEVKAMIQAERDEREDDVSGLETAVGNMAAKLNEVGMKVEGCARAEDMRELKGLIEKLGQDARRSHDELRSSFSEEMREVRREVGGQVAEVGRQVGGVNSRVDQLYERRTESRA